MKFKSFMLGLVLMPLTAFAVQSTYPAKGDHRIRYVNYDPANVVKIIAKFGRQTFIKFSDDERIEDLGGGDTEAWEVGVGKRENSIFIKPKKQSPNTNLTVVTDKRHYNFEVVVDDDPKASNMYMVWFRYPDEAAKARAAAKMAKQTESLLNAAGQLINTNYWVQGSEALTPYAAWDNGTFTYFQFSARKDFPAIYVVNEDGTESLVNTHVEDDTIVVQRVVKKLVFRKGNLVTCIFNKSYDPNGERNPTNTVSPIVERVVRGAA